MKGELQAPMECLLPCMKSALTAAHVNSSVVLFKLPSSESPYCQEQTLLQRCSPDRVLLSSSPEVEFRALLHGSGPASWVQWFALPTPTCLWSASFLLLPLRNTSGFSFDDHRDFGYLASYNISTNRLLGGAFKTFRLFTFKPPACFLAVIALLRPDFDEPSQHLPYTHGRLQLSG